MFSLNPPLPAPAIAGVLGNIFSLMERLQLHLSQSWGAERRLFLDMRLWKSLTIGGLDSHEPWIRNQICYWGEDCVSRSAWKQNFFPSIWGAVSSSVAELLLEGEGGPSQWRERKLSGRDSTSSIPAVSVPATFPTH